MTLRKDRFSYLYFLLAHTSHLQWWIKRVNKHLSIRRTFYIDGSQLRETPFYSVINKKIFKHSKTWCVLRIILDNKRGLDQCYIFSYIWASDIFLIEWQIIMKNDEYENDVFNFINHIEKSLIQTNSYHIPLLICGTKVNMNGP